MFAGILPEFTSMREIGTHKGLAKFGDLITNTAYSLAKTYITERLSGEKVGKKILGNALKEAGMKKYAKNRADLHDMADTAEAFIGYMYCIKRWSIEKIAALLIKGLKNTDFSDYKNEIDGSIHAFKVLLRYIGEEIRKDERIKET